ncbi:MAG TPA: iron-containing alcohol dehydrogenase [Candidatus Acidoferrales bacterium]|nr:iron-containing alcohol dehydrogenase [Candidatus Acidoferrales bacterium]
MKFEFATATKIIFGPGTLSEAAGLAREFGSRALVVTGRGSSRAEKLLANLQSNDVRSILFAVSGEPELATIEQGTRLAKIEQCELVIGIGGGSALDTAKAIAAMLANGGELLDFVEIIGRGRSLTKPSVPFIAIPTTAGTGSEVTRNAVLTSYEHKVKVSLRSPFMLPRVAVVDPELTYELTPALTASTGLDALTQLIEPYVCSRANPMTDGLCVEGIRRVARSLPVAFQDGQNKSAREDMAVASLLGGMTLANAGLGAVHGFAGPIGGLFSDAPHGAICAALLPQVMDANLRALRQRAPDSEALKRYAEVARLLTGDLSATADAGVEWVRRLAGDLKIPRLGAYGIQSEHVAELVKKAMQASSMKSNPLALTSEELAETLRLAL